MLRRILFALAGIAVAFLATDQSSKADDDMSGNWKLIESPDFDAVVCILKVETKEGKPTASVVFAPENTEIKVTEFRVTESRVLVTLKQRRTDGKQTLAPDIAFVGVRGADGKTIFGSTGTGPARMRAKLTATDKERLSKDELITSSARPAPMTKVGELRRGLALAQSKVSQEKDAEKRAELQKELAAVRKEYDEQIPGLYRETAEKHSDTPAAFAAAVYVLRRAAREKLTSDEAAKLVEIAQKQAAPYGPLFGGVSLAPVAEILAGLPGFEAVALAAIEPAAKALTKDDPAGPRVTVLTAYQTVLEKVGKKDAARAVAAEITKLEPALDAEYLASVPPFKPAAFVGRKDKTANRVVVMELFTGAQCPPCIAADVAFDALQKSYQPTDLVLLQYHLHIPGPDPLTNTDTVARAAFYGVRSTPTTLFNGTKAAAGGGGMAGAEEKFKQYAGFIDPLLEKSSDVKMTGKATRNGDKLDIAVEVVGGDGDDMKLRLLVVEETVKYVGGNRIRFHHQVVRAMPDGPKGVVIKDKAFKHKAAVELGDVRKELTKYLDDFAQARPFPKPERPMDMASVRVIALVQNDKTKEIVQAAQIEVTNGRVGGR